MTVTIFQIFRKTDKQRTNHCQIKTKACGNGLNTSFPQTIHGRGRRIRTLGTRFWSRHYCELEFFVSFQIVSYPANKPRRIGILSFGFFSIVSYLVRFEVSFYSKFVPNLYYFPAGAAYIKYYITVCELMYHKSVNTLCYARSPCP